VAGLAASFGSGAMTNSIQEFDDAEVFFVTGSNTTEQHPMIASRIIRATTERHAKLIVADPRDIGLTKLATLHLKQRIGSDVALLNGLMHIILREGWEAEEFIKTRTENFGQLKNIVAQYTPERVAQITGVEKDSLKKAAEIYARAKKSTIVYAMGITQHITGTDNVISLANLAMLTGHVGYASTGVNPLRGQNNVQGACDMGALPNVYSGYQSVTDPKIGGKFEKEWGVSGLNDKIGLTITEMIDAIERGEVRALYVMGENPVVSDPDAKHVARALRKLDLLVAQDIFLTETANLAHVILPSASFAEKMGTYTNTERRVQISRQALEPLEGTLPDWKIICEISSRSGYPMDYNSPVEILNEINRVTPSYGGITYDRLKDSWGLCWPCPDNDHQGTSFLHKDQFTRGLGLFNGKEYIPPAEPPDEEYPFVLTTGRVGFQYHTGTMTRRVSILQREAPKAVLEMNPKDARRLRVRDGTVVAVESRRGELHLPVAVTPDLPEGVVFSTFHYSENNINELTICAIDPVAKIPELKSCAVSISFRGETVSKIINSSGTLVFGIRPCEMKAIQFTDRFMKRDNLIDPNYTAKREKMTTIVIACHEPPSDTCFCIDAGAMPYLEDGYDLQLFDAGDYYIAIAHSKNGERLILNKNFERLAEEDKEKLGEIKDRALNSQKNRPGVKGAMENLKEDKTDEAFWKMLADKCINCGGCVYVCPTCTCFNVYDLPSQGGYLRCRTWDACLHAGFTRETSGHNPRPTQGSRLARRHEHKFKFDIINYGESGCVGCGRCSDTCPVGLGAIEVVKELNKL
jgi:formate dehydrogenase alpha subunit